MHPKPGPQIKLKIISRQERKAAVQKACCIVAGTGRCQQEAAPVEAPSSPPAVVLEVLCEINGGHAAGADLSCDAIAVGEDGGEALLWSVRATPG